MGCCGAKQAERPQVARDDVIKKKQQESFLRRDMPGIKKAPSMSPKASLKDLNGSRKPSSPKPLGVAPLVPPPQQQQQQHEEPPVQATSELQTQGSSSESQEETKVPTSPPTKITSPNDLGTSLVTDFRISHASGLSGLSDYDSDVLSDTDPYGYHQNAAFFEMIDEEDYEGAHSHFLSVLKKKENDKTNLVALLGLSSLYGLGGDAWSRAGSTLEPSVIPQMGHTEKWLVQLSDVKPTSAAPLLALCELFHARGDKKKEAQYRERAVSTGHPLAHLRCACENLSQLKKRRDRASLTEGDISKIEADKQKLLAEFLEISKKFTRVGAKAGKYLWVSYRRGSDGFPRDLQKAQQALERAIHFKQGKDNGQEMVAQLLKLKEKIGQESGDTLIPEKKRKPKRTPPPSPNDMKKVAWSTPAAHSPSARGNDHAPLSPLRRSSYGHGSPMRSDSSSSLKRSGSMSSQVAVTVATINGVEVCAVKDFKSSNQGAPLSPSRGRGKVTSHNVDILEDGGDEAVSPFESARAARTAASETASLASKGRRMSERGQAIHERMRRESTTPTALPAFHGGQTPSIAGSHHNGSNYGTPRRVSLKGA